MGVESSLNPSDPGCLTRDRADGSSTASRALNPTSPNTCAWVSGWDLSCREEGGKETRVLLELSAFKTYGKSAISSKSTYFFPSDK